VATTAGAGIATAAKEAGGALRTALADHKTQGQLVRGLDVAVDTTLGAVGVAMYASAAPGHRDNITQALDKLKDYVNEVASAKSQPDLDKASRHFADFIKLGGSEALDAVATVAGGTAAAAKLFAKVDQVGGFAGVIAAGAKLAGNVRDSITSAGDSVAQALRGHPPFAYQTAAIAPNGSAARAAGIDRPQTTSASTSAVASSLVNGAGVSAGTATKAEHGATVGSASPQIHPHELTGKSKTEIEQLAADKGL